MLVDVRVCGVECDHAVALIDDAEYGNNCGCGPVSGFLLENITRGGGGGGKTQHRESLRGQLNSVRQHMHHLGGSGGMPP